MSVWNNQQCWSDLRQKLNLRRPNVSVLTVVLSHGLTRRQKWHWLCMLLVTSNSWVCKNVSHKCIFFIKEHLSHWVTKGTVLRGWDMLGSLIHLLIPHFLTMTHDTWYALTTCRQERQCSTLQFTILAHPHGYIQQAFSQKDSCWSQNAREAITFYYSFYFIQHN